MRVRLFLDKRSRPVTAPGEDPKYPVKVSISSKQETAYVGTGVRLAESEWSQAERTAKKPAMRIKLDEKRLRVEKVLEELRLAGRLHGLQVTEIKNLVATRIKAIEEGERDAEKSVLDCFKEFTEAKKREGTIGVYNSTVRRLRDYSGFKDNFTFLEITPLWLADFDSFLSKTAPSANARAIHLRNIRAVFNYAISKGYTTAKYPFAFFKIKKAPTKDRSLTREELLSFFSAPCSKAQRKYRDIFLLSFLCCGINLEDLLAVKSLRSGRIEIDRIKTGQPISIKVPDEALEIIEKYKGETHLLDIYDSCSSYKNYQHRLNDSLKTIGSHYDQNTKRWVGEPLFPDISYYWARYSWATIAAELDIPERTIGAALAHSTAKSVTSIYTRVDMRKKIDAANRKVIDFVFNKK